MGLPSPPPTAPRWGPVRRVLFRFAFVYQVLYILPFPLTLVFVLLPIPVVMQYAGRWGVQPYRDLWDAFALIVDGASDADRAALFRDTAVRTYGLDVA